MGAGLHTHIPYFVFFPLASAMIFTDAFLLHFTIYCKILSSKLLQHDNDFMHKNNETKFPN
jgi:hypothetical protein